MRNRTSTAALALLLLGGALATLGTRPARAEHFDIGLIVRTSKGRRRKSDSRFFSAHPRPR